MIEFINNQIAVKDSEGASHSLPYFTNADSDQIVQNTADIADISSEIDTLETDVTELGKLTYYNSLTSTTTSFNTPSSFKELWFVGYRYGEAVKGTLIIPKEFLSSSRNSFYGGAFLNTSATLGFCVSVSLSEIVNYGVFKNGTEYTNNGGVIEVWYKK